MADDFEGYRVGDVTYSVRPDSTVCFPVRVTKVGKQFLDVEPLDATLADEVSPEFRQTSANRRFERPVLTPKARFGGCDERPVNAKRGSGPELRLLPTHYGTTLTHVIRKLHETDPARWPLPRGELIERWFRDGPVTAPPSAT